jgi:hypothetical protein
VLNEDPLWSLVFQLLPKTSRTSKIPHSCPVYIRSSETPDQVSSVVVVVMVDVLNVSNYGVRCSGQRFLNVVVAPPIKNAIPTSSLVVYGIILT